ncbi:MAG: hypothetical protein AB1656_15675 [Candidatus Omnitrophota bacterium]
MSQKNRKVRSAGDESPGSNVLFTLGLVSVVALLIVGWVMTQGGMDSLADKAKDLTILTLGSPTPTPVVSSGILEVKPSPLSVDERINLLVAEYEAKAKQENEAWEKRLEQERRNFENQINNLKIEILSLQDENKRLREKK